MGVRDFYQAERGLVSRPDQGLPAEPGGDVPAITEHPGEQVVRDHHPVAVPGPARHHVGRVRVHRHRGVGDQRPRRGRPDEQVGALELARRPLGQRAQPEPDRDGRIGDRLVDVRLAHLVVGQRGAAARAVRADPVVADQQSLLVDPLQRPPDRLDVAGVHGPVGVVGVGPVAHPPGHLQPRVDVPEHRLAAARVERGDPVRLDVPLAGQAEFLLHRDLDRQPVAVPAGLARDVEPLHGLEPGEQVLEGARLHVVRAGHPVGGRRSLVEDPARARPRSASATARRSPRPASG